VLLATVLVLLTGAVLNVVGSRRRRRRDDEADDAAEAPDAVLADPSTSRPA
jgi:hypothetical protein